MTYFAFTILTLALAMSVLGAQHGPRGARYAHHARNEGSDSSPWFLVKKLTSWNWFDEMNFFQGNDPSHGMVDYVGRAEADNLGLIATKAGQVYMHVHHKITNGTFKSVRPATKASFTEGIFVLEYEHMPTGCGLWPAFFTTPADANWPAGGEIDIIEGVHDYKSNTMSIHTAAGCTVDEDDLMMRGHLASSAPSATDCDALATHDQGCGVRSTSDTDYGTAVNKAGWSTHVMVWDNDTGIKVWHFNAYTVPDDITKGRPEPDEAKWGKPFAEWPATHCDPEKFFSHHAAVFSNTVCGAWAGSQGVWDASDASGQTLSCKEITGADSCEEYMNSNPDMSQAYWVINSLHIYQKQRKF